MNNINKQYTVNGTYGSGFTPDQVHVCQDDRGVNWYVVDGSVNVNATMEDISEGVHVEYLQDVDCFTMSGDPITDLDTLAEHVSDHVDYLSEAHGY